MVRVFRTGTIMVSIIIVNNFVEIETFLECGSYY